MPENAGLPQAVSASLSTRLSTDHVVWEEREPRVMDMFSFLLARDTMHQNKCLVAIEELKEEGLEDTPAPSNFPREREIGEVAYRSMNFSGGEESAAGRWAEGPSMDGNDEFENVADPQAMGPEVDELAPPVEPRLSSTPKQPMQPSSSS